ncbi:YkoF-like protein [Melanogaster broomeanus]|nr:YkoF-like protein [Melanogaster broomeanus]
MSESDTTQDLYAVADFCLIPMGTSEPSVAKYIAKCQSILEETGLTGYGTNLEGPWSEVSKAIHDCHAAVHAQGAPRIATDIRIGTRIDREVVPGEGNNGKVRRVQEILATEKEKAA